MSGDLSLARKHLDKRFRKMKAARLLARPRHGWIRAIRDALGMSAAQLADRIGVSQPRITALEHGEIKGSLSLQTLEKAAEALDCTLVYALVPNRSLEKTMREQAEKIATARLKTAGYTMAMEGQSISRSAANVERRRLVENIMHSRGRRLWDRS